MIKVWNGMSAVYSNGMHVEVDTQMQESTNDYVTTQNTKNLSPPSNKAKTRILYNIIKPC